MGMLRDVRYWPGRVDAWVGARALRALLALPEGVIARLAGAVPEVARGLHPEAWLIGRLAEWSPDRTSDDVPVAEQRRRLAIQGRPLAWRAPRVVDGVDVSAVVAGGVPARLYVPEEARAAGGRAPLLVYFHGGGWVQGSVATHDASCRLLAAWSGVRVVSVDYRLAPEHPYPAAVEDAVSAWAWAAERWPDAPLAVGGDSAGGNLAAVVAQVAEVRRPDFQLLIYPVTDVGAKAESYRSFASGYLLTESGMDWYMDKYVGEVARRVEPAASPLRAASLAGLAPAYVATCLPDVLRDEGEAYALKLREAGVRVAVQRHPLMHGFFNVTASRACREGVAQIAGALRQGLAAASG